MGFSTEELAQLVILAAINASKFDGSTNPRGLGGVGYKTNIPAGFNAMEAIAQAIVRLADEAEDSAAIAASYLRDTTSSSSVTIGAGTKTFIVDEVRAFSNNDFVTCVNTADENEWVHGQVSSWDGVDELVLTVDAGDFEGSGTISSWDVLISAPRGPKGAPGAGDLEAANNLSDVADAPTALSNLGGEPADADIAKTDTEQSWSAAQRIRAKTIAVAATSKTLALSDANTIQECTNAGAQAVTLDLNANVAFAVGDWVTFEQHGAGVVTIKGASGVTVNGVAEAGGDESAVAIASQWGAVTVRKIATDSWIAYGSL